MPRLILALLFVAVLFVLLCGPVLAVALRLRRRGDGGALRPIRAVWLVQVVVAGGLVFAADRMEMRNPAGWVAAVIAGVGLGGAGLYAAWRLARRMFAR
jgi:hypothetical protein